MRGIMVKVKGKVENGKILALEPVDEAFEGREVTITLVEETNLANGESDEEKRRSDVKSGWQSLMKTIEENQISTGVTDMAHQHDHYLYGTPKRED